MKVKAEELGVDLVIQDATPMSTSSCSNLRILSR